MSLWLILYFVVGAVFATYAVWRCTEHQPHLRGDDYVFWPIAALSWPMALVLYLVIYWDYGYWRSKR